MLMWENTWLFLSMQCSCAGEPGLINLKLNNRTEWLKGHVEFEIPYWWDRYLVTWVKYWIYIYTINEPYFPWWKKAGHPQRRTCLGQHQTSSVALGRPGDGDCYLMHKTQSGGWPYPYSRLKFLECSVLLCSCSSKSISVTWVDQSISCNQAGSLTTIFLSS